MMDQSNSAKLNNGTIEYLTEQLNTDSELSKPPSLLCNEDGLFCVVGAS